MATPKILLYEVELRAVKPRRNFSLPVVYTNDLNSVEFQFKVIDMNVGELSTATATTMLYMRDGSFFQNPKEDVSLVGTTFSYKLKENEGNHAGIAKIQLVVKIGGVEYATQLYDFEIINGLETKVAVEVMIYDWTTLTRDAQAYIDQFVEDEVLREAEFDNAQLDRTTAFNESESGRITGESERVTAESSRVTAESGRVTKESQRVTAESSRVTAEDNRVTAENARVTAETNRSTAFTAFGTRLTAEETATANNKISAVKGKTFADVDARFEDVEADTVLMATNKVVNGDLASGLTGWSALYASLSAASNVLSITGDGTNATPRAYQITTGKITANTKIYATQLVKVTNAVCSNITIELKSDPTLSALGVFGSVTSPTQDVAYRVSGIVQAPSGYDNNNIVLFTRNTYADGATASGKVLQLSVPIVLNLTEIFGVGNEPTAAQMDGVLAKFASSYFGGTANLFRANATLVKLLKTETDLNAHRASTANPHAVTKLQVGLGNVDNTSDLNKPISTAGQTALNLKANKAQEAWITPTLVNGATGTFQYRKNEFGRLEFKGELTQSSTASYFCITIAGYRPPAWIRCPITSIDGVVSMLIMSDGGALYLHTPLAGKTISFSGISINIQ